MADNLNRLITSMALNETDYKLFFNRYMLDFTSERAGAFGKIIFGYDLRSPKSVAVKQLLDIEAARNEFNIMKGYGTNKFLPKAHDFFIDKNKGYIIMEYIDGTELGNHLGGEEMEETKSIKITRKILKGLKHLHAKGFLHTDVQPENIMIKEEKPMTVKLIDFGCAVKKKDNGTWTGKPSGGTWEYMPPEQFNDPAVLDESSDLYSAAGVCIYLLTGKAPFLPSFSNGPDVWEEYLAACRSLHSRQPKFSIENKALEGILLKATSPEMAKRYRSAEEFIDALDEIQKPRSFK